MDVKVEKHLINRSGWLRAAVLGANDGILSTASIVSGVAAGGAPHSVVVLTGLASLVAGATSMATGEYVSVSSQVDVEKADLDRERQEILANTPFEQEELAQIYVARGVEVDLARRMAGQMMEFDALGAHARDELGISDLTAAKPVSAAISSALSFAAGSLLPLLAVFAASDRDGPWVIPLTSLIALGLLGAVSAYTGGTPPVRPMLRVVLWGAFSMACTALVSHLFHI